MLTFFILQRDDSAANSTHSSYEIEAFRSILWGAFHVTAPTLHANHQIDMVAIPKINPIQMGCRFTCRPSFEKTISHVFLNPLRKNCIMQIAGNCT